MRRAVTAEFLGKDKVPTAGKALREFFATDAYAAAFQPIALLQEREADRLGAEILLSTGYDPQRALRVFDKLAEMENRESGRAAGSHDPAGARKQAVARAIADLQRSAAGGATAGP